MKYIFSLTIMIVAFTACNNGHSKLNLTISEPVLIDTIPGSCPYLTKDSKGNVLLSWVRSINDSTSIFCYATSTDGKTFTAPVSIPTSTNIHPHAENLPKIIAKPSGELIALWGAANPNPKNKYSGLVFYSQSFDSGKTWSNAKQLTGDTSSYDQRYYDVALLPDGEAAIIWLDNRKATAKEGSGLYFARTAGANGFQNEQRISQLCCQCCRTQLFIDAKGGIHAIYRGIINDSIRDMMHIVSTDDGKQFSEPVRISNDNWVLKGCPHTGPSMTENNNGLHFAWFTGAGKKGCYFTSSSNNGESFAAADSVSSNGSHPQLTTLSNGQLLLVWDEAVQLNNKIYKRIASQLRNENGINTGKTFLTAENAITSYPVITALPGNKALIVYSEKKGEKNYISYTSVE
ncbi:MAG: sialidase family protein [Lacibacter sp.]